MVSSYRTISENSKSTDEKVLVTGANSLLGTHVIQILLAEGYFVRGLLRDERKFQLPPHASLDIAEGSFTHLETLEKALAGCDFVIHVAAVTSQAIKKYATYHAINVKAVELLMACSVKAGIKKVVFVGSANAMGYGSLNKPGDETRPIQPPFTQSYYAVSKLKGQQTALSFSNKIEVTVANPTFMLGAYDAKPGSGRIILMGLRKKIIFYPPGGKNFVNAADAADGVVQALKKGKNGEAYLLCSDNLTYKAFFKKLSHLTQNHPIYIQVPRFALLAVGIIGNLMRMLGISTQLSLANMKALCINNFYSNQKARLELNVKFEPIDKGIIETVEWFDKDTHRMTPAPSSDDSYRLPFER